MKKKSGGIWLRRLLLLLVFLLIFCLLLPVDDAVTSIAAHECPSGTFLSGQVYESWHWWTFSFLCAMTLGAVWQAGLRIYPPGSNNLKIFVDEHWGKTGLIVLAASVAGAIVPFWITSSSEFCLAHSGIYQQSAPWRNFQIRSWKDVTHITVDCRNRRRGPDLIYELKNIDGMALDIGTALPSRTGYSQLRAHLAGVPFQFSADIQPSCPEWFANWVGQRP